MSHITSCEIRLTSHPTGIPTPANFSLAQTELEPLQDGQVLVRNLYSFATSICQSIQIGAVA
jgi:NADPH-dependent curcumin reductase CurA